MNKSRLAVMCIAITPYLSACNSSDRIGSEEIVLDLTAVVTDNEVNLRASFKQRLSNSIVVSVFLENDRLYVENKDKSEIINLSESDDGSTSYSASILQDIGDDVELVFDRTASHDEVLSSKINIPFFYRSLKTTPESTFLSGDSLVSISWYVDSLDNVTAPNTAWLNSNIINCVDNSDLQIDTSNVRGANALSTLDMEGILEQALTLPSEQIAYLSNEDVQGTIQYCDYAVSLTSNWLARWNGSEPATGEGGPVWISPNVNYGNGKVEGDEPAFGITVNANPATIRVMY